MRVWCIWHLDLRGLGKEFDLSYYKMEMNCTHRMFHMGLVSLFRCSLVAGLANLLSKSTTSPFLRLLVIQWAR